MANHTHSPVFKEETADQVIYHCTKCKRSVGFWKPETGRLPTVVLAGKGQYSLPEESDNAFGNTVGHLCDKQ